MKPKIKFFLAILTVLLVIPASLFSMTVTFYLGKATLARNGKNVNLKVGDVVSNGDIIKTEKNGMVEVSYGDSSKLTIKGDTMVRIGSKNVKDSTDVAVISGEVTGKFGKLKKGEYRLGTPTTVCGVRGTEFTVAVSKGGDSRVQLNEGSLDVRNGNGRVKLKQGFSVESDLAGEPVSGETEGDLAEWRESRNESLEDDLEGQAAKYEEHINNFGEENGRNSAELKSLSESTKKISNKDELERSGNRIAESETAIEDGMLMSDASKNSVDQLKEDYGSRGKAIRNRFEKLAKECNKVQEEQMKNYKAIQKVKEEYKEAYDKIMKRYKDDKSKIFRNLEDFKKNQFKKDSEETETEGR